MSGFLDKIGLRPGGFWFNDQPIFDYETIKIRPILGPDYLGSSSRIYSPRSSSLFFKPLNVNGNAYHRIKCILKRYQYISVGTESLCVKVKGPTDRYVDFTFLKLLSTTGICLSHLEGLECYLPPSDNCILFLKFKKIDRIRKCRRRLLRWLSGSISLHRETLVERISCSTDNNPVIVRIKISSPTGTLPIYMDFLDKRRVFCDSIMRHMFFERFISDIFKNEDHETRRAVSDYLRGSDIYNSLDIRGENNFVGTKTFKIINDVRLDLTEFPDDAALRDVQNVKNVAISLNKLNLMDKHVVADCEEIL